MTDSTDTETVAITSLPEMEEIIRQATAATETYAATTPAERAAFLEAIGEEILLIGDELISTARKESGLAEGRLIGERGRTIGQLGLFASVLREGSWVEAVIDQALPDRKPAAAPDLRKMLVPIGPVLVFGASNFPFAFSTAGGDTASALAAGNPVIVKAHEGHLETDRLVTGAMQRAARRTGMPAGVFASVVAADLAQVNMLVRNETIRAIGFTGSLNAGTQILKTVHTQRQSPIPVYAEMSSVNPVVILPGKLSVDPPALAATLGSSIVLGCGQFCTNPGLLFLLKGDDSTTFINTLSGLIRQAPSQKMLNEKVSKNYYASKERLMAIDGVTVLADTAEEPAVFDGLPSLLQVSASSFIQDNYCQAEVFGPSSLIVLCDSPAQLEEALQSLEGQLTATIFGTDADCDSFGSIIQLLKTKVGRLIFNGVPTGVEVAHAMVHGGPFPATTDSRSTSVGADAIKRFARPVCLQDCPQSLLPEALKDHNGLDIMRKLNGSYSRNHL